MPMSKLKQFLDTEKIPYQSIPHSTAYTAQGIAAVTHISGKELAKTVIVKLDDVLSMAVLPASQQVDLELLKSAVGAKTASLASEREFRQKFPDCETGAMPPFGHLYELPMYVEESLSKDAEIAFNACTHNELIKMTFADFMKATKPKFMKFSVSHAAKAA